MSYIDNSLLANETVIERAKVHWIIYVKGLAVTLIAMMMLGVKDDGVMALGTIILLVGIVLLANAYLFMISTELGLTNKRVIAKVGFISRNTVELNLTKVESLSVDQSIFGRIFNYGVILVNGTGGVRAPFGYIADPLSFRKAVNQQIEIHEENSKAA